MKKNLLLAIILVLSGIVKLNAQACTLSNLTVDIKNVTSGVGGCQVTLDATFTAQFNNGNKYAFIHLWETAPFNYYPNPALTYKDPPTATQLANSVGSIVIKDPGSSATLWNKYPPDTTVPVKHSGITFTKTGNTFSLKNIVINLSTCGEPVTVKGDLWASQADDGQTVQCSNGGLITILFNNPLISGIKQCATPRLLNLSLVNDHATVDESVVVSAFIDNNNNGDIDGGDIDITNSLSPALPNPINLAADDTLKWIGLSYSPYSSQSQYDTKPIIVRANATAPGAATVVITKEINFLGSCALLPVNFTSFTAKRDQSNVVLQWETSFEQNNDGFAVERNINGVWNQLAFIPSQAAGGNSNSRLIYKYDDLNASKAVTQYRIKQVDIDGQFKYSQIRSVFGEAQAAKVIVYPTPSSNGKVSVVFEETNGTHDISLMDMTGRVIKQWKAVYNNIQIDNLTSGIYHLRIVSRETGIQTVEKVVVSRK